MNKFLSNQDQLIIFNKAKILNLIT